MLVPLGRAPTWRPHTKLYKFRWNSFPNNAGMKHRTDLNLGEVACLSVIYHIPDSWLNSLNSCDFYFPSKLPISNSREYKSKRASQQAEGALLFSWKWNADKIPACQVQINQPNDILANFISSPPLFIPLQPVLLPEPASIAVGMRRTEAVYVFFALKLSA